MKRSILSERNLVVVLFVMVVVIFSFAQADTPRIEKMYLSPELPTTVSPYPSIGTKAYTETEKPEKADAFIQLR